MPILCECVTDIERTNDACDDDDDDEDGDHAFNNEHSTCNAII